MDSPLIKDSIWRRESSIEELNKLLIGTLSEALGMRLVELGPDFIEGTMPVDSRTVQPFGILHGGASAALAETLGSIAAHLCVEATSEVAVGLEINTNHIRAARTGVVTGRADPVHIGRSTQVWSIRIRDEKDRTISVSRLTMMVTSRPGV